MSNKAKKRILKYQQFNQPLNQPRVEERNWDFKFWTITLIILSLTLYIIVTLPFLTNKIMAGHDAGAHYNYTNVFQKALAQGQFPVRITGWTIPGFDQPLFNFYQPGFYYLVQSLLIFGADIPTSINLTNLLLYLLGCGLMFLFVRNLFGTLGGLISAAFYAFAPYHISDIFVRSAFPESTALAFVPGVFWASERFISTKSLYWLSLISLFTALILISHPPTFLMFSIPILLFYLIFKIPVKTLAFLFGSLLLGFLLAGFFIIPAILEQPLIQSPWLKIGYYDFHQHFACLPQLIWSNWGYGISTSGCDDGFSFQLGLLHWGVLLILLSIFFYSIFKRKVQTQSKIIAWVLLVSFIGMFLTLEISKTIWENTPFFPFIQYPWRFLSLPIFALSVGSSLILEMISSRVMKLVCFTSLILLIPITYAWFFHPYQYYEKSVFESQISKFTPEFGYFPKWTQILPNPATVSFEEAAIAGGEGKITKVKSTSISKQWAVEASGSSTIQLFTHYFPNWQVKVNEQVTKFDYSNEFGFISVNVNGGYNIITANYSQTSIQKLANLISVVALLIIILIPASRFINNKELIQKFSF